MEVKPVQKMVVVDAKVELIFAFSTMVSPAEIREAISKIEDAFLVTCGNKHIASVSINSVDATIKKEHTLEEPFNSAITYGSGF